MCFNTLHKKMKFPTEDFFSKCDQIRRKLRVCSCLIKNSLMENFIFCAVIIYYSETIRKGQYSTCSEKTVTEQKLQLSITDILQIWSHLLKKPLMKNFIFLCSVWRIRFQSVLFHILLLYSLLVMKCLVFLKIYYGEHKQIQAGTKYKFKNCCFENSMHIIKDSG